MSKRRSKARRATRRSSPPKERALQAFRQGDYAKAIAGWSRLEEEGGEALRRALAETHFRRALGGRRPPAAILEDLRRSTELLPGEGCYWYHLGLALHRADQVEAAGHPYGRAAELGYEGRGLGYVRALAALESDPRLHLEELPWLCPEDGAVLALVAALLRGEAQTLLEEGRIAAGGQGPGAGLWRGLAHLALGDAPRALESLRLPGGQHLKGSAEQVRLFYLGLAAGAGGKPQESLEAWREAGRVARQSHIPLLPQWGPILAGQCTLHLCRLHEAGQWAAVLEQVREARAALSEEPALLRFGLVAAQRLAFAAVEAGDWATARRHWQDMDAVLEAHSGLGPRPPVLRNLALACEQVESWEEAAEAWAAFLRALPRRASKKNACGIPVAEQRTWLRRRIVENYRRAGCPERAIAYYKQAIKASPGEVDLRLELAEALLANEQSIAARNEVRRILDRDSRCLEAHLLLAQIHQAREEHHSAEEALRRILKIDPRHQAARRGVVQAMIGRGIDQFNAGQYRPALKIYTAALEFGPEEIHLLVLLGDTELALNKLQAARLHLEKALDSGEAGAYEEVFECWVRHRKHKEARRLLARAEEAGVASHHFYIGAAAACFNCGVFLGPPPGKKKERTPWEQWGGQLIDKGLEVAPDPAEALGHVLELLAAQHPAVAIEYARRLAELKPEDPEALLQLGLLEAMNQEAAAGTTLSRAERLARRQGQRELVREIARVRRQVASPLFGLFGPLLANLGAEIEEELF